MESHRAKNEISRMKLCLKTFFCKASASASAASASVAAAAAGLARNLKYFEKLKKVLVGFAPRAFKFPCIRKLISCNKNYNG